MHLLWKAAGADFFILERSTYSDQVKYLCLGGIILATGIMAGLSGGYAFYTIFAPRGSAINNFKAIADTTRLDPTDPLTVILAVIFGTLWGLMIFNLDRFIISSTGKGDGTEAITKQEIRGALPRLLMGAIIAVTISKPIEIRMFKTEIDIKLHEKQQEQEQAYKAHTDSLFNEEIAIKDNAIRKIETQLDTLKNEYGYLKKQYIEEGRKGYFGPKAQTIKAQVDVDSVAIAALQNAPDYLKVKQEKENIEKRREAALNQSAKYASGLDGLLERIKISEEVSGPIISLFITLLFLAIELTPIFFKMMLIKSPYDYLEENIKELVKAESGLEIIHGFYPGEKGVNRDKVIYHEAIKKLKEKIQTLETQSALSSAAIDAYKEQKIKDVHENPTLFVKETESDEV
jgi:hypothetical protein